MGVSEAREKQALVVGTGLSKWSHFFDIVRNNGFCKHTSDR